MEEPIVVGIDIGTTKVCTLVAVWKANRECASWE
jgi:cell division ATPase FtsA